MLGAGRQGIDAEGPGIAEGIQDPFAGAVGRNAPAVLPLVGIETGLLPARQIDQEAVAVFHDLGGRRWLRTGQQAGGSVESFMPARYCVAPFDHPAAAGDGRQLFGEHVLALIDGQRAGLEYQVVGVAVDGQSGEVVALGVDQAVDVGAGVIGQ